MSKGGITVLEMLRLGMAEKGWEGRKEMFLFNDALNTFYLWIYGISHMVKNHSDR